MYINKGNAKQHQAMGIVCSLFAGLVLSFTGIVVYLCMVLA